MKEMQETQVPSLVQEDTQEKEMKSFLNIALENPMDGACWATVRGCKS